METIKDYFNEKNILSVFFPGLLATYPLLLILIKYTLHLGISFKEGSSLPEILGVALIVFVFVSFYGIGYFIKRFAVRTLEQWFSDQQEILLRQGNFSPYNDTWYRYLSKKFQKDNAPIIIGFYNDYVNNYHFELTCIVAFSSQLILMWVFDGHFYNLFNYEWKIIISIISSVAIRWLFIQAKASTEELHTLRVKINSLPLR